MRNRKLLRVAILLIVMATLVAVGGLTTGCATLKGGLSVNNVTKDYQTAQKAYTLAQQTVRDAYLNDLIDDARYKKFIDEVDARAMQADAMIVKMLKEAEKLEGVEQKNKLNQILALVSALSTIAGEAGGYTK